MENYRKGKNIEEPLEREKVPIPNLPANFLWMQVRGGSKIRNLLGHALNEYKEAKVVVWTGFGQSVGKTITCAEIMKRECCNSLYQITKLCYRSVEEYWDPVLPDLDQIVVKRKLPMIHIVLSVEPLDEKELGYQAPGVQVKLNPERETGQKNERGKNKPFNRTPTKEFAAMKMGNKNKRRPKNSGSSSSNKNCPVPES